MVTESVRSRPDQARLAEDGSIIPSQGAVEPSYATARPTRDPLDAETIRRDNETDPLPAVEGEARPLAPMSEPELQALVAREFEARYGRPPRMTRTSPPRPVKNDMARMRQITKEITDRIDNPAQQGRGITDPGSIPREAYDGTDAQPGVTARELADRRKRKPRAEN